MTFQHNTWQHYSFLHWKNRSLKRLIDFAIGYISTIVDRVCGSVEVSIRDSLESETNITSCFDNEDPFFSLYVLNISNQNFTARSLD